MVQDFYIPRKGAIFTYNLKIIDMVECKDCKGTGKITITVKHGWPGQADCKTESTEIGCVDCDGTGELTEAEAKAIEDHENDWCSCGNPSEDAYYVPDGKDNRCLKHHWRCKDCDGIYQIG